MQCVHRFEFVQQYDAQVPAGFGIASILSDGSSETYLGKGVSKVVGEDKRWVLRWERRGSKILA